MKKAYRFIPLFIASLLLSSCGLIERFFPKNDEKSVASIALTHSEILLGIEQFNTVKAVAYNSQGKKAESQDFTWSVTTNGIISTSPFGYKVDICGLQVGTTNLVCTSAENKEVSAIVSVTVTDQYVPQKVALSDTYKDYTKNNYFSISSAPTVGTAKILIVPVWFEDSGNYIKSQRSKNIVYNDIKTAYLGTEEETGWHSVKSYYETESRGALTLEGFVTDWYAPGVMSTNYYVDKNTTKTVGLVNSAYDWYLKKYGVSTLKDFDRDSDGYIDAMMLIYAAPDSSSYPRNNDNMWAYCYWTGNNSSVNRPTVNAFFWASYDFMYSSGDAYIKTGTYYGNGDSDHCKVDAHTYIHEMGHIFGAQDYYDYSSQFSPAGGFSMQDLNVGAHDPFTRMAFGWETPYIPRQSCEMVVSTYENSGDLVLLTNKSFTTFRSPFTEYILLELYSPTGLNAFDHLHPYNAKYPNGAGDIGFRIWHVDARLLQLDTWSEDQPITEDYIVNEIGYNKGIMHAMSNTYYKQDDDRSLAYISPLGTEYANYNILQLIRNNRLGTYQPTDDFANPALFRQGSTFSMTNCYKQFVQPHLMNDGSYFPWTVNVKSIRNGSATIELIYEP